MLVTCPHCGDKTEQDVLLLEFTCGECDRPFRTDDESYAERWSSQPSKEAMDKVSADAALIAAAPEMYEALSALVRNAEAYRRAFNQSPALRETWGILADQGRAALAKARGETN